MSKKSLSFASKILLGEVKLRLSKVEEARANSADGSDGPEVKKQVSLFNVVVVLFLRSALQEVFVMWDRREVRKGNLIHIWVQAPNGFKFKFPFEVLEDLDKELAKKVRIQMTEKLYFPTLVSNDFYRNNARLETRISRDAKRLSIESQIPESLEVLPEATRPHPLAVRGVQGYGGNILTTFVFKWAVVPPWEMGTDSLAELNPVMESVLDGTLSLPDGNSLISDYDRDYYQKEIDKRREKREFDIKQVSLATHMWNGYSSCEVTSVSSREAAIKRAAATVNKIRREDHGEKIDNSLLGSVILFDDGHRILFHIQDGYDFYGMRIHHTYIYFDQNAVVKDDQDGVSYEQYMVHILSMKNGELLPQTR